ncbi:MAG: very short patch repair endonuclease [Acidimicrobiales bacterium]
MKGNRRRDTRPEQALRSLLHKRGRRFRVDLPIPAESRKPRPDVVFTRQRVAVFVDGCFWHRCPRHGRVPGGANREYWVAKMARNQQRDLDDTAALTAAGWKVVRIWEHVGVGDAVAIVEDALLARSDRTP